jgi:hypothetical protein
MTDVIDSSVACVSLHPIDLALQGEVGLGLRL